MGVSVWQVVDICVGWWQRVGQKQWYHLKWQKTEHQQWKGGVVRETRKGGVALGSAVYLQCISRSFSPSPPQRVWTCLRWAGMAQQPQKSNLSSLYSQQRWQNSNRGSCHPPSTHTHRLEPTHTHSHTERRRQNGLQSEDNSALKVLII